MHYLPTYYPVLLQAYVSTFSTAPSAVYLPILPITIHAYVYVPSAFVTSAAIFWASRAGLLFFYVLFSVQRPAPRSSRVVLTLKVCGYRFDAAGCVTFTVTVSSYPSTAFGWP